MISVAGAAVAQQRLVRPCSAASGGSQGAGGGEKGSGVVKVKEESIQISDLTTLQVILLQWE